MVKMTVYSLFMLLIVISGRRSNANKANMMKTIDKNLGCYFLQNGRLQIEF